MEDWLRARGWLGRFIGRPSWGRCAMAALLVDGHSHHRRSANRQRSGLGPCDSLVVTKFDHLARSLPEAGAIAVELTFRQLR